MKLLKIDLLLTAVFLGALVGSVTAVFLQLLYGAIELLWHTLPSQINPTGTPPYFTLMLGIIGGLLVGLCHKYLGDHPKLLQKSIADFRVATRSDDVWKG